MKNFIGRVALCAICYFLSSCSGLDYLFGFKEGKGGVQGNSTTDPQEIGKTIPDVRNIYVSAIDDGNSSLVLFKNGERILEIPYGEENRISPVPDMHHLIYGKLFTEYHDENGTTIKVDGEELFSYEEEETLKGLLVEGNDVFTLGKKCSMGGFVFRKNGVPILESNSGTIYGNMYDASYMRTGALYKDRGSICFAYYTDKWHLVIDGKDNIVSVPAGVNEIYDLRIVSGTICFVCKEGYTSAPVLYVGQEKFDFSTEGANTAGRDFRLYPCSDGLYFCGSLQKGRSGYTSCWSMNGDLLTFSDTGCTLYRDEDSCAYVQFSSGFVKMYTSAKGLMNISGNYEYLSCWNADYSEGVLRVVFSPKDRNQLPFLWENGVITTYDIQGSLTSVYYGI